MNHSAMIHLEHDETITLNFEEGGLSISGTYDEYFILDVAGFKFFINRAQSQAIADTVNAYFIEEEARSIDVLQVTV